MWYIVEIIIKNNNNKKYYVQKFMSMKKGFWAKGLQSFEKKRKILVHWFMISPFLTKLFSKMVDNSKTKM